MCDVRIRLFFKPLFLEAFSFVKKWHIVYEKTIKKGRDDMILNITDENWAEVIEDTLTVETFTALKKYIHALESSQRDFPDSVTKLVVNEAKCNMKSHEIKQLLDKQPLRRLETISISKPDKYFCTVDGLLYSGDKEHLLFCPRGRKGVLVIPDETKNISDIACLACSFSVLMLPDAVESIGAFACYRNTNLERVEGGKGIRKIYNCAFLNCQRLKHFELGSAIEEVGDSAFMNTTLTEIDLPDSIWRVGRNAFNTAALHNGKNADVGPDDMYNINIPASIKYVEPGAFSNAANVHTPFVNRKLINACLRRIYIPAEATDRNFDIMNDLLNRYGVYAPANFFQYCRTTRQKLPLAFMEWQDVHETQTQNYIRRNRKRLIQDLIEENMEDGLVMALKDGIFQANEIKDYYDMIEDTDMQIAKAYALDMTGENSKKNVFRL